MAFLDELKKITRPYDEDEDFYEEEAGQEEEFSDIAEQVSEDAAEFESYAEPKEPAFRGVFKREREPKAPAPVAEKGRSKLIIANPESFEEAAEIADNLREKCAILMNIENAPREVQRRLIDFLSGVAYALGGKIKRVSAQAYIISPTNVDVVGDTLDDFESSGFYF